MEIKLTPPVSGATLGSVDEVRAATPEPALPPSPAEAPPKIGNKALEGAIEAASAKARFLAQSAAPLQSPYAAVSGPAGAFYRKVESLPSKDARSISAKVVLPEPQFDSAASRWRMNVHGAPWKEGPCDRPSVYLGGNSGKREVDAGLSWDRVYTSDGSPTWTTDANGWTRDPANVFTRDANGHYLNATTGQPPTAEQAALMKPNCAFRPYVRTSNVDESQLKGLSDEQKDAKKAEDWHSPQRYTNQTDRTANVYFYPGDRVNMKFGLRPTTKDDNRNIELTVDTEDGSRNYSGAYGQKGWPGDTVSFKRVNSIDQVGAEKSKQLSETNTTLKGCRWESVRVQDKTGGSEALTQRNGREVRGRDTEDHYSGVFQFRPGSFDDKGSETVDIYPAENR